MNFNLWKNYTSSIYLFSSFSLSTSKRRANVYVISHRQKFSSCLSKNVKFSFVSLSSSLNYQITWLQFRQQQIEKNRITKEKAEIFSCKRCFVKFFSNIKLHEHVRTKHAKKFSAISITITLFISSFITSFISSIISSTTSRISISWVEIISRSMTSSKSSRISRFTALSTSSFFSILLHQESINQTTKRLFITSSFATLMKSYLSMQNLYIKFHEKFKSSSFSTMQQHLSSAFFCDLHQKHITSYFKSVIDINHSFELRIKLVSNRKNANSKSRTQSTWIDHLTLVRSCNTQDKFFNLFRHCSNHSSISDRRICMNERQHHCKIKIV